jgi:hypothetical protein
MKNVLDVTMRQRCWIIMEEIGIKIVLPYYYRWGMEIKIPKKDMTQT